MSHLPEHVHHAGCGCYGVGSQGDLTVPPAEPQQPQIIHQHIHQAPPDRTVQRLALGSGVGAGAVAAGVYFGPLLVGVLTAIAANLALLALIAAVSAWGVVQVVRAVGSKDAEQAVTNVKALKRRKRGK